MLTAFLSSEYKDENLVHAQGVSDEMQRLVDPFVHVVHAEEDIDDVHHDAVADGVDGEARMSDAVGGLRRRTGRRIRTVLPFPLAWYRATSACRNRSSQAMGRSVTAMPTLTETALSILLFLNRLRMEEQRTARVRIPAISKRRACRRGHPSPPTA